MRNISSERREKYYECIHNYVSLMSLLVVLISYIVKCSLVDLPVFRTHDVVEDRIQGRGQEVEAA